jgi:hypothetical protein
MGSERRRSPECATTGETRRFPTFPPSLRNGEVRPFSGRSGQRREVVGCSGNAETDLWRSSLLPAAHPNRSYYRLHAERRRISARCGAVSGPSSRGNCKYLSPTLSFPLIEGEVCRYRRIAPLPEPLKGDLAQRDVGTTGKQRNRRKSDQTGRTVCRSMQIQR